MTSSNRLTTIDSQNRHAHHDHQHVHEDEEIEELADSLPARIFDASFCGEPAPEGFDAVRIVIDGTIKADLSWKKEREAALAYITQGLKILWEIDLGLPGSLHQSLGNRTQFLGLTLSLEHFCNTLWKEYRKETVGLCLYRGPVDFTDAYPWDEEQILNLQGWIKDQYPILDEFVSETHVAASDFTGLTVDDLAKSDVGRDLLKCFCRDAVGEYFSLLAARVPDSLPLFLLFDTRGVKDSMLTARLLSKERYPRFHIASKIDAGAPILGGEISWDGMAAEKGIISREIENSMSEGKATLGFCLPRMTLSRPSSLEFLSRALDALIAHNILFRVIPEVNLAAEWDGLDYYLVDNQHVEIQFKRKLQGFCAAGGTVVYLGQSLGLAQEIPFEDWFENFK